MGRRDPPGRREAHPLERDQARSQAASLISRRRILWNAIKRDKAPLRSYTEGAKIGIPIGLAMATAAPIIYAEQKINDVTDAAVADDLAALPGMIDRIDAWIASGVIGGEQPNAADFQIATGLRLAMTLDDLRPAIEVRPAGEMAIRVVPTFPGRTPAILPAAWLAPLRATAAPAA